MNTKELLDLKDKIERGKTKLNELKGQRKQLMKQLEEEFGCDSIEAAEKKLKKQEQKIEDLDNEIAENETKLRNTYPILFE